VLDNVDASYGFDSAAGLVIFWNTGSTATPATPNVWQSSAIVTSNQTQLFQTLNATFYLSQIMLTTDFNQNTYRRAADTYGGELSLAQRYCFNPYWNAQAGSQSYIGSGKMFSATITGVALHLPVPMRSSPQSLSATPGDFVVLNTNGTSLAVTSVTLDQAGPQIVGLNFNVASGAVGGEAAMVRGNVTNPTLYLESEL